MKKILLALMLSLLVVVSACNPFATQYCNLTGPANAPYRITYPCVVTSTNPCYVPDIATGTVKPDGTFRVPQRGVSCSYLQSVARFGIVMNVALSASPASVYLPSPPASGTITGQSFDATYGMPRVDYFDSNGYLVGSVNASYVSSDSTLLQANMPDMSNVYSGNYLVKVTNMTYDGYYLNIVGSAPMTGWGKDRPDSDGDGWYDDQDCDIYNPARNYDCSQSCSGEGGYEPRYTVDQEICPYY
ncbi:MAG TPA: hypothetical protein VF656_06720 [Pyrinomonadaceae bacterium]|jgi:hypothetical protein